MQSQKDTIWRIGSRESALAVAQTRLVMEQLQQLYPERKLELVTFRTMGDKILSKPLTEIGGKGLFVRELDEALMEGRIDLAVHSLKDVPMEENPKLPLLAFPKRGDARDVLVFSKKAAQKAEQELGLCVGTSSQRRSLQIQKTHPKAQIRSVRGNIQTRLRKLDEGEFDVLILAAAGLLRCGFADRISRYLEPEEMLPAAGQGILAVQGRADFPRGLLEALNDENTMLAARAERAFVRELGGGCTSPVAAYAVIEGEELYLRGLYVPEENEETKEPSFWVEEMRASRWEAEQAGVLLAKRMRESKKCNE